jgi:hypothetical protein
MAKSDIIASLKLNSTDYEQKLAAAKKKTKSFGQESVEMFKGIAAAVAGSKAAMEVFNRVIASSQTIGDKYAATMQTAKSVTDQFVYALANADFSRFRSGLNDIISKSREAYNALDQLGNTQISYNYLTGRNRAALRDNLTKVRDTSLPMADRQQAYANAQAIYAEIQQQTGTYKSATEAYIKAALADVSGLMKESIQTQDFVGALMVDIGADPASARAMIEKQYAVYQREAARIGEYASRTTTNAYGQMVANVNYDPERAKADMAALNESNRSMLVAYNLLFKYTDEELKKLTAYLTQADNASYAVGEFATQIREAGNALNQPIKPGTVGSVIAPSRYNPGAQTMAGIPGGSSASALPDSLPTVPIVMNQITESSYTAADGIYAVSAAMSDLSGAVGDGAAAWIDWGANLLSAIASAIPAIGALTAAKNAEATANTAAAATGAGSAVAGIPVVGPVMAVAAIASVVAALAKLPKFATGGVVPGGSLSGDNVLIRANSGEVVLTKQQANNIGSALAGLGGNVRFVIEGDKLVGVLNNHNRITSRSYGN